MGGRPVAPSGKFQQTSPHRRAHRKLDWNFTLAAAACNLTRMAALTAAMWSSAIEMGL
jgi:hypothetical protein